MTPLAERLASIRVKAALPPGAQFGKENFAGDDLVNEFVEWSKLQMNVQAEFFVSWACPPDVFILRSPKGDIVVRSERFDPLLIEYIHLKFRCEKEVYDCTEQSDLHSDVSASILRWMAEFLLGYRWPQTALDALLRAFSLRSSPSPPRPFRDEILASVPNVLRTALQCFCLAHELAHLMPDRDRSFDLGAIVDGLALSSHVKRDIEDAGQHDFASAMLEIAAERIDARNLLREIDADLMALDLVCVFLCNKFGIDPEEALAAAISAFESQCFLYALKHSCMLLKRHIKSGIDREFLLDDWISSTQVSVRARCVLRRAGILLSHWCAPDEPKTAELINQFVPIVDSMFARGTAFRSLIAEQTHEELQRLFSHFGGLTELDEQIVLRNLLEEISSNPDIKLDLFYLIVGMGYSGATDPLRLMRHLAGAG